MAATSPIEAKDYAGVHGTPGERPRLAGLLRASWPLLFAVAATGYLVRALFPVPALSTTAIGFVFLGIGVVVAVALLVIHTRLTAFMKGARGEEWVARELGFLPAGYDVYHGVVIRRGIPGSRVECDHVVVGPHGVFAVETKNWRGRVSLEAGRILYEGRPPSRPPLDQVRQAAGALREHLRAACGCEVPVSAVLCFAVTGTFAAGRCGTGGVTVCESRHVREVVVDGADAPLSAETCRSATKALKGLIG